MSSDLSLVDFGFLTRGASHKAATYTMYSQHSGCVLKRDLCARTAPGDLENPATYSVLRQFHRCLVNRYSVEQQGRLHRINVGANAP